MTSAQVVKMLVTTTNNSPSQDFTNPDNQTTLLQDYLLIQFQIIQTNIIWIV